jgi:hypothetical protein
MAELTPEGRAELRRLAEGFAADERTGMFGPKTMLLVLDALDAAEAELAGADERAWRDVQPCHYAVDPERGMGMHPVYCSVPRKYHTRQDHEFKEPKPLDKMGAR